MSLQDSLFSEDVEHDVTLFSKDKKRKRVLVFPPVNNYRRFIIHQLVQDRFDELHTFSIGQGAARRTVVCYKSDVIRDPKLNGVECNTILTNRPTDTVREMGVEGRRSPSASPERVRVQRQVKSVPAVEIYRPPAARRPKNDVQVNSEQIQVQSTVDPSAAAKNSRQKRPDRAVYVPRHRRSLEPEGSPQPPESSRTSRTIRDNLSSSSVSHENSKSNIFESVKESDSCNQQNIESTKKGSNTCSSKSLNNVECEVNHCQIDVNNRDSLEPLDVPIIKSCNEDSCKQLDSLTGNLHEESQSTTLLEVEYDRTDILQSQSIEQEKVSSIAPSENKISLDSIESYVYSEVNIKEETNRSDKCRDNNTIIITSPTANNLKKEVEVVKKLSNKDQIVNHKNSQMIRRNMVSDVLIISDNNVHKEPNIVKEVAIAPLTPPEKKVKKIERPKSKPAPPPSPPIKKINRDECDWDTLFDDNGDCLDPTLIEELTSAVGEVMIEQPKNDYKAYTKHVEVSSDEFAHVVEIYNFPSEYKTSDLAAVFSPFKNGGFELKWVDDTHCLGVFSSPLIAAEVLASDHPFVKTRPLSEATALSKTKAKRSAEFLQPYRTRPETCAALARRLVTGALGVRLATARQEREHEKNVLREAKEKRRLANKQREDAWEGIIPEK